MNIETIESRVKAIIAKKISKTLDEVKGEITLTSLADSLDVLNIIMDIEENFDIEIPDEAIEKITTVQQAIDYVASVVMS